MAKLLFEFGAVAVLSICTENCLYSKVDMFCLVVLMIGIVALDHISPVRLDRSDTSIPVRVLLLRGLLPRT